MTDEQKRRLGLRTDVEFVEQDRAYTNTEEDDIPIPILFDLIDKKGKDK